MVDYLLSQWSVAINLRLLKILFIFLLNGSMFVRSVSELSSKAVGTAN